MEKKRSWTLDAAKESMPQEVKYHEMKTKVETSSFFLPIHLKELILALINDKSISFSK